DCKWMHRNCDHCNCYSKSYSGCNGNTGFTNYLFGGSNFNCAHEQCCSHNIFMASTSIRSVESNSRKRKQHCTNFNCNGNNCGHCNTLYRADCKWMHRNCDHCNSYSKSYSGCNGNTGFTNYLFGCSNINCAHKQC